MPVSKYDPNASSLDQLRTEIRNVRIDVAALARSPACAPAILRTKTARLCESLAELYGRVNEPGWKGFTHFRLVSRLLAAKDAVAAEAFAAAAAGCREMLVSKLGLDRAFPALTSAGDVTHLSIVAECRGNLLQEAEARRDAILDAYRNRTRPVDGPAGLLKSVRDKLASARFDVEFRKACGLARGVAELTSRPAVERILSQFASRVTGMAGATAEDTARVLLASASEIRRVGAPSVRRIPAARENADDRFTAMAM